MLFFSILLAWLQQAFATVKKNIDNQAESTLKEIENAVYEELVEKGKNELIKNLKSYFENNVTSDSLNDIIDKQLKNWENTITQKIKGYTNKMAEDMKEKILEQSDKAVSELKDVLSDKMSDLSSQICGTITNSLDGLKANVSNAVDASSSSGGVTLNYKEYCKIFVFLKIMGSEESMLQRCGALVEANVKAADNDDHSDFKITNAYTLMYVEADVKMHTLFPWGVETDLNEVTGDNNYGFSLGNMSSNDVKIHYSGVYGY